MRFNRLIEKYDKKYNEHWIEYILTIFDNHRSNIELIDFFKNNNLTPDIFSQLEFIIKDKKDLIKNTDYYTGYEPINVFIVYNNKQYKTPFYLDSNKEIEFYAMFNRHFGKKYLIKYLDSLTLEDFLDIFNSDIFDDSIYCLKIYLYKCVHFTPEIILEYMVKLTNKSVDKIMNNIDDYITKSDEYGSSHNFWYNYSKIQHTNIELYINWPWSWCSILKFSKITIDFIETYRDIIVDKIFSLYLSINKKFKIEAAEELFNLYIFYNKHIPWAYKETLIDRGFNYIRLDNRSIDLEIDIGLPDNVMRDIIYNKNNRYSLLLYYMFKDNFLRYRYFPEDIVDYIYINYRSYLRPIKVSNSKLEEKQDNTNELLKCSSLELIHDLFYSKYVNITVDTILDFNKRQKEDYLEMDKMDLQLNGSYGWYHLEKYYSLSNIEYLNNKKPLIDIEIDKYHDYYFRHLKQDNFKCKLEYYIDNLNLEYKVYKIQKWWKKILYNPHKKIGHNFALKNIEFAF